MTKDQVKTGMLVQCRNEGIYLVINNTLIDNSGFLDLRGYTYDLRDSLVADDRQWDIMKVTKVLEGGQLREKHWKIHMELSIIWDRNESVNEAKSDQHSRTEQFDIELDRWVERDRD